MRTPKKLRAAAERYRQLADSFTDRQTVKALLDLADEYEAPTKRLEKGQYACEIAVHSQTLGKCYTSKVVMEVTGMSGDKNQKIRERAHQIWEQAGRPEGRDADHWRQAESEIHEGADADSATGAQADTELTRADQAEATAAGAASEVNEGADAEAAVDRLSQGDELSQKPSGTRPGKGR